VTVVFLLVAALGFTQTRVFRTYLRTLLIENAASSLHAELTLDAIEGNLFTGFHTEHLVLRRGTDSVLTVRRVEAHYDPLGLLTHSVSVSRIILINPVFHLKRSTTGAWNIGEMLRSTSKDTTSSTWTVNLKQVQFLQGHVHLFDSLDLARRSIDSTLRISPGRIDYANLQIDSLGLDAGLSIRPHQTQLMLRSLSCRLIDPKLQINDLAGDFLLSPRTTSIQKLVLRTGRSRINLDARIDSVNISSIKDVAELESAPVTMRLKMEPLDFDELKEFVGSPVKFLEGDIAGQVDLAGRFGSMEVRNVTLHTGTTTVKIAGTLANLHHPKDLDLDLECAKNVVDSRDLRRMMPTLKIPDLARLGPVEYDLQFKGKLRTFHVRLASNSLAGNVDVDGNIDLSDSQLSYDGTIRTSRLNLAPVTGDSAMTSRLKSTISIQGVGTRLSELTCVARADIDSSEFYGLPLSRSVLIVDVADRTIHPRVSLRIGSARIDLGGTILVKPQDLFGYDLSGRINSLNLSDITKQAEHTSDVSFDIQTRGDFKNVQSFTSALDLNVFRSTFDTVTFAGGPATIRVNTLDANPQTLTVTSDVLDLEVGGRFTVSSVVRSLGRGVTLIGEGIAYRINSLDAVRGATSDQRPAREFRSAVSPVTDDVDYRVALSVKDFFPVGVVLGREMEGSFRINGSVQEGNGGLRLDVAADVEDVHYADQKLSFGMETGVVSFKARGLDPASLDESMVLSLGARAKHFLIQNFQTSNMVVALNMVGDSSQVSIEGLMDSVATVKARGTAVFADRLLTVHLDQLHADFNSQLFQNTEPVFLTVGRDGLLVSNLQMHHEHEQVSLTGLFNPAGSSNLAASVHNILVSNIPNVVRRTASVESLPPMSGVVNANATFDGSFEEPSFSLDMNATGVHYDQESFGTVQVRSSYADRVLNIFAQLHSNADSSASTPELLVNGTIPYDLSLTGSSERKLEGEMNLDVQSSRFRLEFLGPFIPELSELSGTAVCNMKLRGTIESPAYEGSMVLQNARFLFNPLGITYVVDGKLVPSGRKIAFEEVAIRNIAEDRPDGTMNLSGSFSLEGLKIRDFDLIANGQLLVMKESARRANQGLYGDLFAGSGPLGISWKGSPSLSFVAGEVFVRSANLTLPPARQAQDLPNARIEVRLVNDTVAASSALRGTDGQPAGGAKTIPARSTKTQVAVLANPAQPSKSFLDNIVYNLSIETQGVTQLRFVFSNFTNEQLLAELKGRTAFTKDGDQMHLTGELDLGNRSYYNNFKKLDATGKVRFTGDPLNPELDIVATYTGTHRDTTSSARLSGGSVKVVVKVYITGAKDSPKVRMGLAEYDQAGNLQRERPDMEGDAIAFLVTGSFRDELTQQDKLSLAGSSVLGGVASSILSGPLTDLLRKEIGLVRSVDVLYYGGTIQETADVRLTGEVGDAVFRLGGRVFSDLNNTNISIQLPMSAIVGSEKWRNLVLEAERTVLGVETVDQRRESKGVRLLYRIIF
jgi:hypothetical protein